MEEEWSWVRRNPVAALTALVTVFGALDDFVLSQGVTAHWLGTLIAAQAFLSVVAGALAHRNTTSLVKPRAADGTPLVKIPEQ